MKSLPPDQRLDLARSLATLPKARPVRRVWIPKPGKAEKRPLGIPVMRDRAAQTLARLALEPEWEARFEPNSYGFRPGRSCHDALVAIHAGVCRKPKYVLDADIASCFDRIDHAALLRKLDTFPALRRVIHGWLEAGVLDDAQLLPTDAGTPQGGAISPLLANVALHGLEAAVRAVTTGTVRQHGRPMVIRYADDFVVLHDDLAVIERVQQTVAEWLAGIGLELKPSKTRITHTLHPHGGQGGFDFLGCTVRQFPVGRTRSGRAQTGVLLGHKTIIRPSSDSQKRHLADTGTFLRSNRQLPQRALIDQLNRKIQGWANYHAHQASKKVFSRLDFLIYCQLKRWAERRHPKKSRGWVARHYWHSRGLRNWVFGPPDGQALATHASTPIRRHIKVRGDASPYDGDLVYWASRLGRHPELPQGKADLLKRQNGRCAWCGLFFTNVDELIESDHALPRSLGGSERKANRQLLHGHCHDQKTATDGSHAARGRREVPVTRAKIQDDDTACQED